jgi:hypothetical protein
LDADQISAVSAALGAAAWHLAKKSRQDVADEVDEPVAYHVGAV